MQANYKAFNCGECNCDDEHNAGFEKWYIPEIDLSSAVCLRWLITPRSVQLLKLYNHYANNILPVAGGWLDQPNVFSQAIDLIGAHKQKSADKEKKRG